MRFLLVGAQKYFCPRVQGIPGYAHCYWFNRCFVCHYPKVFASTFYNSEYSKSLHTKTYDEVDTW